ncbi:MAG: lipocalin-like domain-containing protein [Planctomycetes bacterium]|nr:lipocalin-like domain-containing protein [Planctomycetota bacterium]
MVTLGLAMGCSSAASPVQDATPQSQGNQSSEKMKNRFVGTWKLVKIERRDAKGELLPPPTPPAFGSPNPIGFIMYDPAGYMGVAIMQSGRQKNAGNEPTPEEAKALMASYLSYFGTYTINEAEGFVTHHVQGGLSPALAGADQKRFFELSGNRLTLKPPRSANGVQQSLTWERVPDLENLTAMHRQFIGFWKLVSNERRDAKGEVLSSNPGQTGFIIYTSSGYMAVHLMQPDRKKYAAAEPTPEEAREALRTYASYFGRYIIDDTERYVTHDQIGILNMGRNGPSPQQRFYEFSGKRLILKPPPTTVDGQQVQGVITWERMP